MDPGVRCIVEYVYYRTGFLFEICLLSHGFLCTGPQGLLYCYLGDLYTKTRTTRNMFIISRVFVYRGLSIIILLTWTPVHENPHFIRNRIFRLTITHTWAGAAVRANHKIVGGGGSQDTRI